MAIKKHNLGLVPSSWYRWMLFCKLICQEPSKLSEHYSEDLLNRMFSELVKELSSSRITYMPYEVTDDSSTDSLKGLGYFAGLLSKQTEKIVPYFPDARNELNNIISDLNFAKNITEFAESHLFPGLERRHENLAYDVDNRTFTFFPPLNQEGTEKGASSSSPRDSNIRITAVHFQVPPEYSILKGLLFGRTDILARFRPLSYPFPASSA